VKAVNPVLREIDVSGDPLDRRGHVAIIEEEILKSDLSPSAVLVYALLFINAFKVSGGRYADISLRELSKESGLSYPTIQRDVVDLIKANLIRRIKENNREVYIFGESSSWIL